MPFTTARGTRFHTMELGSGHRTQAPVVMLHGLFTGSLASWYLTCAPALSARRRVRLLDWRGHGLSVRTRTGYGAANMAADLAALTADLPPFTLVGHSYGCVVGLRFLQAHPDRVRAMALVEPPLTDTPVAVSRTDTRPGWPDAVPDSDRSTPGGPGHAAPSRTDTPPGHAAPADILGPGPLPPRVRALIEETALLDELAAEPPVTDADLRDLAAVPCLAVSGARSPYASAAERIRRACPSVRAHRLDAGHDPHVTHAADLTALLTGFLDVQTPEAVHA